MALLTELPLWLIIFVLALGAGYALLLYHKNYNIVFEKRDRIIMASLRGVAMTLIAFLIMVPMVKLTLKKTDKPLILVAVDNSESLICGKDAPFYQNEYPKQVQQLIDNLGNKYEVKTYLVGSEDHLLGDNDKLVIPFNDKSTNLASLFDQVSMLYSNRNVGAMVMLTDGIYNVGTNPYYRAEKANYPVYTVGLGNTELSTDLFISEILHNKQALKGNLFPVEIKVTANKLSGKSAKLTVSEGDNEIFSKNITISGNRYFETVKFSTEAKTTGIHRYNVTISELDGEMTYKNNRTQFYVEVVESKDKVIILYNAPHPDVAAMREALEMSANFDVEVSSVENFQGNVSDYSLVILHQLPSAKNPVSNLLSQIRQTGTSALYILGSQTNLTSFNALNTGITVAQTKQLTNNAMPLYNDNFTSFTFSEETKQLLTKMPPVKTIFGTYKTSVSANVFMYQKISGVDTKYPLIAFNEQNGTRTGIITGTGFWTWKLYDYLYTENHDGFNEIINKSVIYLATKGDKSRFRVHHQNVFAENAPVEFTAELYNDSYELINDPDIKMVIKGRGDTTYEEQFSKQNNGYYLNVGNLPVGDYTWTATTQVGNKKMEKCGRFSVQEVVIETANLVADHDLLKSISNVSGGKFFHQKDLQKVAQEIKDNDNIKPIATYQKKYAMMLNSVWYFVAIILLLGVEWFLRKWHGGF